MKKTRKQLFSVLLTMAMLVSLAGIPGLAAAQPTKDASVNGLAIDNGTNGNPVAVDIGDLITYTLTVSNTETPPPSESYDILFTVDWSSSMSVLYNALSLTPAEQSARMLAKNAILSASRKVVEQYPGSRVAIMGLNAGLDNTNSVSAMNIQFETDFVGADQYAQVIEAVFDGQNKAVAGGDDNAMFLRMAKEKMQGNASTSYGGRAPLASGQHVIPRADQSRIPVVVLISDFQIEDSDGTQGSWSSLHTQANAYHNAFPNGILLALRCDHAHQRTDKPVFMNGLHTTYMNNTIAIGGGKWKWEIINDKNYTVQGDVLADMIQDKAPAPHKAATVTDLLPAGLEYVGSTPNAAVSSVNGRDEVTWDVGALAPGDNVFTLTARVKDYGVFENTATVEMDGNAVTTNGTYHEAVDTTTPPTTPPTATPEPTATPTPPTAPSVKALSWMRSSEAEADSFRKPVDANGDAWTFGEVFANTPLRYFENEAAQNAANQNAAAGTETVRPAGEQLVAVEHIWDGGNYFDKYKKENGNILGDWAAWRHFGTNGDETRKGDYSLRRFTAYFDMDTDAIANAASVTLAPTDELGDMSYLFPVNDDVFVFVNGNLAYWGGTDLIESQNQYGAANRATFMGMAGLKVRSGVNGIFKSLYPHTDGWCIDLQQNAGAVNIKSLLVDGFNRIDIITDDYYEGGGMNRLNLFVD